MKYKYDISLNSTAINLEKEIPSWEKLHYKNVSNKDEADKAVSKILDSPVYAPNGYHIISGSYKSCYGQDSMDAQLKKFERKIGLLWHLTVTETIDWT